jgi:hypothetical protein
MRQAEQVSGVSKAVARVNELSRRVRKLALGFRGSALGLRPGGHGAANGSARFSREQDPFVELRPAGIVDEKA